MNKLQMSTTAGIGGVVAALGMVSDLFVGYNVSELWQAILTIPISEAMTAFSMLAASIFAVLFNEEK